MANKINNIPEEVKTGFTFQRKSDPSSINVLEEKLEAKLKLLNSVCNSNDTVAEKRAHDELNEALADYNHAHTLIEYENICESKNPMLDAVTIGYITNKKVVAEDTYGIVTYSLADSDEEIDYLALSSIGGRLMSPKVLSYASQMRYELFLSDGIEMGNSAAALTTAFQKSRGNTVLTVHTKKPSTKMLKQSLQNLVDAILFLDNGSGQNRFMITTKWWKWFDKKCGKATYGKGYIGHSVEGTKKTIQDGAAMLRAYLNEYGISSFADNKNVVVGKADSKAEESAA